MVRLTVTAGAPFGGFSPSGADLSLFLVVGMAAVAFLLLYEFFSDPTDFCDPTVGGLAGGGRLIGAKAAKFVGEEPVSDSTGERGLGLYIGSTI